MLITTAAGFESFGCVPASVTVSSAPSGAVVATADAKQHFQVHASITVDDTLIAGYVAAAVRWVERCYNVLLLTQTVVFRFDAVPAAGAALRLPRSPLTSVSSVVSYDAANVAATLASSAYLVDVYSVPPRVALNDGYSWPADLRRVNAIEVTAVGGFGASADVPIEMRQAICMLAAFLYEQRSAVAVDPGLTIAEMPFGPAQLLSSYLWI